MLYIHMWQTLDKPKGGNYEVIWFNINDETQR